jgi:hypothetical protein
MLLSAISCLLLKIRNSRKLLISSTAGNISNLADNKLNLTGFAYSPIDDAFYSQKDAWQREFGYCHLYDEAMPLAGIIVDCEPIYFDYNNKHWLIEFRKGQYGMATGGEIGIYNTSNDIIKAPGFHGVFYESIPENEWLSLKFILKKNKKVLINKKENHWWLAGLKFVEFSNPNDLSLDIKIDFPNKKMRDAFESGLTNIGYTKHEYSKHHNYVHVHFTKPHSTQPVSRTRIQESFIQQGNETNCNLYHEITSDYSNTIDKLDYIFVSSPDLYNKFLKSFHSKELYSNFELINPILKKFNTLNRSAKIDDPFIDSYDI